MELKNSLLKKEAYLPEVEDIQLIQTHISQVFLTGKFAYKVLKPVDFGFLDFSTLDKRKKACEDELQLNKLISPDLYVGVVKICKVDDSIKVDSSEGEVIEYAIKMKQCHQDNIMTKLLERNEVSDSLIKKIAKEIFKFHNIAPTSQKISEFGSVEGIDFNWQENFEQTAPFVDDVLDRADFEYIKDKVNSYISNNKSLFEKRVSDGMIKQCHGDLHSGNIFVEQDNLYIFDAITFNQRFACSDIVADIAFMAMDLDFHDREDFSELFIETYSDLSKDEGVSSLLNFYKCYRAYVRAKVNCFMKDSCPEEEKADKIKIIKDYFALSKKYAKSL